MSTSAQVAANQANAQLSTGPTSAAGQAIVGQNNFRHGFTGAFKVLPWENQQDFRDMLVKLCTLHQPQDEGEIMLVEKMAQHYFLTQRALALQEQCFSTDQPLVEQEKQLALYLRYQTTHDRAFHKCADELRKSRNEKRKCEIGFESQERNKLAAEHKQLNEKRKQELHGWAVLLAEAKLTHQQILSVNAEFAQSTPEDVLEKRKHAQKAA